MMERTKNENKERKHVCRFCSKEFSSRQLLWGHLRIHNNNENHQPVSPRKLRLSNEYREIGNRDSEFESSFGLRKNPKRAERFVDQSENMALKQQLQCQKCGNGFDSLGTPSRHMACHLEKKNDDCLNSTPFVSEIQREFVEQAAWGLVKLKKDLSFKKGSLSCLGDSLENKYVVPETKSSSADLKCVSNSTDEKNKTRLNLNAAVCSPDDSGPGYFLQGPKKAELDVSDDGFIESKELDKRVIGFERDLVNDAVDRASTRHRLRKKCKYEFKTSESTESAEYDIKHKGFEAESYADPRKRKIGSGKETNPSGSSKSLSSKKKSEERKCPFCPMVFISSQALGDHARIHYSRNREQNTVMIEQQSTKTHASFDLNLPQSTETRASFDLNLLPFDLNLPPQSTETRASFDLNLPPQSTETHAPFDLNLPPADA